MSSGIATSSPVPWYRRMVIEPSNISYSNSDAGVGSNTVGAPPNVAPQQPGQGPPQPWEIGEVVNASFEAFKLAAERAFLAVKLRQHDWNVAETARALDMPRSNLYKKIERHGLARETE